MESKNKIGKFLCRNAELWTWVGDAVLLCSFCANELKCLEIKETIKFFNLKSEVRNEKAARAV